MFTLFSASLMRARLIRVPKSLSSGWVKLKTRFDEYWGLSVKNPLLLSVRLFVKSSDATAPLMSLALSPELQFTLSPSGVVAPPRREPLPVLDWLVLLSSENVG